MPELLQEYWILILVALVIGVVVAWWIFHASRRTKVEIEEQPDAATQAGKSGAKRNQALIDADPVAQSAASPGPLSAAANHDETAAAPAVADAEAGAAVPAREAIKEMADAEDSPPSPASSAGDDLKRIKGVGPKLVAILHDQGVNSFAQIASWSDADIDRIDAELGRFAGRIRRDNWVEQARLLASNDLTGYEAHFGKV
ncbi:MAG: hypothetical protein P1U62_02935 [Alteraurantiacibacter sp. bin_em_oilr2.035]|nr:hypothetical protein [Alteraurantiacibacter sp. bin_em_oilr2.035]